MQKLTPVAWNDKQDMQILELGFIHRLCYVNGSNALVLVSITEANCVQRCKCFESHHCRVYSVLFHPYAPTIVSCGDDGLFVWDIPSCTLAMHIKSDFQQSFPNRPRSDSLTGTALHSLCWAKNGKLLCAGCSDGSVLLFDASSFSPPPSLTPSYSLLHKASVAKGTITTLLYSPVRTRPLSHPQKHRLLFLAGHDRSIHLCSIHSHGLADEGSLDGHVGDVTSLALSPDENVLFSGGRDHSIRLWDVTSRSYLRELRCSAPKRWVW